MVDLYPHNQEAYNKVKSIFETNDRTCIVHATGTGKSLIAGKLILDNPKAKFLFVAPTIFIFKEIKKYIKGYKYNIQYRTYSSFLNKPLNRFSDYDYIIFDEFHRIGAKQWGEAIEIIINQNNQAKLLGLSATHIRFLDDNRNMAEEIFDNNIASYLSLGEAIEKGIHKVPTYISALYNIKEILDDTESKLSKSKNNKEIERLKSNRIIWEKSNGVDFILKKYISINRKKILVFCKNVKHIDFIKSLIVEPLKEIYQNKIDFQTIYSAMGVKETLTIFDRFETHNKTQVLFCVDMLNEGIHVQNVDTILMFRDTISPIIYFQQMGRSFAVGQKQNPLIFDFVNNFNIKNSILNIQQNFYQDFNNSNSTDFYKSRNTILNFYDEALDFQNFINEFIYLKTWEENYKILKDFVEANNRLPNFYENKWLAHQRTLFNKNNLQKDKIELLLNIQSNIFDEKILLKDQWGIQWEKEFRVLKEYISKYNKLPSVTKFSWLSRQRQNYKKGKLSKEQIDKLNKLNESILNSSYSKNLTWEENYKILKDFVEANNRLPLSKEITWLNFQKKQYRLNKLSQERIDLLLKISNEIFDYKILVK